MKIDLHIHSKFSDGEDSPEDIVRAAKKLNMQKIALTDHDTVDGIDEFLGACDREGIIGIPAIELSSERHKEVHILGYAIDYKNLKFVNEINKLKELRHERNLKILKLLQKYKVYLSQKDIMPNCGETVGRMKIAKVMKEKGYVANIGEAFDKYLSCGKKAYVRSYRISPEQAIEIITSAGGVAVLAHPFKLQLGDEEMPKLLTSLKEAGLGGIEAYYTGHTAAQSQQVASLAQQFGLFVTAGSDYHGRLRAGGIGEMDCPDSLELSF